MNSRTARRKLIAKLNRLNRVRVMPGGGVTEANLSELLADTGCTEFHASARVSVASNMRHRDDCARLLDRLVDWRFTRISPEMS